MRIRITIIVLLSVCLLIIFGTLVGHFSPSSFSSEVWKNIEFCAIDYVVLEPVEFRNYSVVKTISKSVHVENSNLVSNMVAQLNGKYTWNDFGVGDGFSSGKRINIRIVTKSKKPFLFCLSFYRDDSFVTYSEIYKDSYNQFTESQKQYGYRESSAVLCDLVKMILQKQNVSWVPAYEDKNPGGFFQPSYEEWQRIKRERAGVRP